MIWRYLLIALYALLVALSAFFSSCEITFARANKKRLKSASDAGDRRAAAAVYIGERYTRSLSTVLVGNNLVNIAASSAATVFMIAPCAAAMSNRFVASARSPFHGVPETVL